MARLRRHRASSAGSYSEGMTTGSGTVVENTKHVAPSAGDWQAARELLQGLLYTRTNNKGFLHQAASTSSDNEHMLYMAKCVLERCQTLDTYETRSTASRPSSSSSSAASPATSWQERFLTQTNRESGYTPLHSAVVMGNLPAILLYLQYPASSSMGPMAMLHAGVSESAKTVDAEGLTPMGLLNKLQVANLRQCRLEIQRQLKTLSQLRSQFSRQQPLVRRQNRSSSFDQVPQDEDDEFQELRQHLHLLGPTEATEAPASTPTDTAAAASTQEHAFEVVTFGRPHHCALGVISSGGGNNASINPHHTHKEHPENHSPTKKSGSLDGTATAQTAVAVAAATFRPQRVQEFAQERVLREGSAVAVAAATHHTLVACRNGQLYVFGLNKGGRLGLGDDCPPQCPLPRRIVASLKRKHVKAIAAAENHSLCVTSDGCVWAWGSNQFGQLGENTMNGAGNNSSSRSIPKQVEELKQIPCVAVAAGERHSVALSARGEVYTWGNNASGQLGVARRSGNQKVQRVEALWNGGTSSTGTHQQRKVAIAIAAADQSTLVLTAPTAAGLTHVNSVYWWGHGNHAPMRVPFDGSSGTSSSTSWMDSFPGAMTTSRLINPVGIACGKYHNAAITSDGRVYTWGTSSESLGHRGGGGGGGNGSSKASSRTTSSSPQLVTGMLPENGGGFAVAVSASEQHTAVVTDSGALFTWGVAHGKNVMGHKGVRWQPNPKRVPGVHRAVNVAVAKEHTVVLVGTTFPAMVPAEGLASLQDLSARTVARHVDLFNVLPILIMAEHSQVRTFWLFVVVSKPSPTWMLLNAYFIFSATF